MAQDISVKISREAAAARELLAAIKEDIAGDEQAKADAIEGETDLHGAISAAIDRIAALDAMGAVLKAREAGFAARRHRFDEQKAKIKRAIVAAMEALDQRRLELPTATVYTSVGKRSAIVTDENKLPAWALIPQPPKVDKAALSKALIEGAQIDGAELSNTSTILNIRTG